jgi:phospholipid/cholesterol/gamma-HCH transport system substrate-binding protein
MKRRDEFLVGIFTTLAVLLAGFGTIWLVRGGLAPGYRLFSRFPWGQGLKQGQPVWLVGINVGFVDAVELEQGTVLVTMRINKQYKVPEGSYSQIMANGLFGDMAIGITPPGPGGTPLEPGDTIPSRPSQTGIQALTQRADTISGALTIIMNAMRSQLVDSGGIAEVRRSVASLNRLTAQLSMVVAAQSRELQTTMGMARSRIAALDSAQIDSTIRSTRAAVEKLDTIATGLGATMTRVNTLIAKADSGSGALSRFLHDPAVYDDIRGNLATLNALLVDIQKNPRKYINLSIF